MAVQVWKDMRLLYGAVDIAMFATDVTLATEVAPLDVTSLRTVGNVELIGGLKSGTVNMTVMSDPANGYENVFHVIFSAGLSQPTSVCTSGADGAVAYLFYQLPLSYTPWSGNVGELAMGNISGTAASSPVIRGRVLQTIDVNRSASGSGTGRQLGAVAAGKSVYAALHVQSAVGTSPTLDVKIQSDDNPSFTSPTDRITFSQALGFSSQWQSTPGAITDTYWRAVWTIGGTTPTFNFAVTAGIL